MTFLLNEKSLHGQFANVEDFHSAIDLVMQIRGTIQAAGHVIRCDQSLKHALVTNEQIMPQAIQSLPQNKRRAWIQWIGRMGPFWTNDREHTKNDWLLNTDETDVTNTTVGEAAYCVANGIERQLVSFAPSAWCDDPLKVLWVKSENEQPVVEVRNHTKIDAVKTALEDLPAVFNSWESLEEFARQTCEHIDFSDEAFASLHPHPYNHGAAERLAIRLSVLNKVSGAFDSDGHQTKECKYLLSEHFSGAKAWFTDSSSSEKSEYENELLFPHPTEPGKELLCTWHGKVKTPQLRIHFSWPITASINVYVPYVGPKLTSR